MKLRQSFFIIIISVLTASTTAEAQKMNNFSFEKSGAVYSTYHYGVETLFITENKGDVLRLPSRRVKVEENFFKTHSVSITYRYSIKYQAGLAIKYGNNFYRSSSRRIHQLNNEDRDYSEYLGVGLSGVINLARFGAESKGYPFSIKSIISLQYVWYDGIEISKTFTSRKVEDISMEAMFLESAALIIYNFDEGTAQSPISLFYQPIGFQISTNGFGFQYHGLGVEIEF